MFVVEAKMSQLREAVAQAYTELQSAEQHYKEGEEELVRLDRQIPEAAKGGEATEHTMLMLIRRKEQLQSHLENRKIEIVFIQQQVEQAQEMVVAFIHNVDRKVDDLRSMCAHEKSQESELELMMRAMQAKVPKLRMAVAQAYALKRLAEQDYLANVTFEQMSSNEEA
jgi:phage shock protein A